MAEKNHSNRIAGFSKRALSLRGSLLYGPFALLLAIALTVGTTNAWFTAGAKTENTFTAGTLDLEVDGPYFDIKRQQIATNVVFDSHCAGLNYSINNMGTKTSFVRVRFEGQWERTYHKNTATATVTVANNTISAFDSAHFKYGPHNQKEYSSANPNRFGFTDFELVGPTVFAPLPAQQGSIVSGAELTGSGGFGSYFIDTGFVLDTGFESEGATAPEQVYGVGDDIPDYQFRGNDEGKDENKDNDKDDKDKDNDKDDKDKDKDEDDEDKDDENKDKDKDKDEDDEDKDKQPPKKYQIELVKLVSVDGGYTWHTNRRSDSSGYNQVLDLLRSSKYGYALHEYNYADRNSWPLVGDVAPQFQVIVANTGNVTLTNVNVTDDHFDFSFSNLTLEPGQLWFSPVINYSGYLNPLPVGQVTIRLQSAFNGWDPAQWSPDQPVRLGEYFYHIPTSNPGDDTPLYIEVCLKEASLNKEYSGAVFKLYAFFEAVQTSNQLVHENWPNNPYPQP